MIFGDLASAVREVQGPITATITIFFLFIFAFIVISIVYCVMQCRRGGRNQLIEELTVVQCHPTSATRSSPNDIEQS